MKKIIIIFITLSSMFISSCSLNTVPLDFLAPQNYYTNEAQCNSALTGVYHIMDVTYNNNTSVYFDTADEMWAYGPTGIWVNTFYANDSYVLPVWRQLYNGIEQVNMLLANIDKAQMDATRRDAIKGEAKFLRAYFYFVLVQFWGDVPFKTTATASASDIFYPRTPAAEIYDFIYKEMVEAEGLVPPVTSYTYAERPSKSAVQGMLARVCLFMAGFPNNNTAKYKDALTWSEKVIQSGFHSLNPDYKQVFINLIQDKYDLKENIWEMGFRYTGTADTYFVYGEVGNLNGIGQNIQGYGSSTGNFMVQDQLWKKYAPGDTRRDWAIASFSYVTNSNPPVKTYWDTTQVILQRNIGKFRREYELTATASQGKRANGTNFPLLRYSDVLLMAAEAENEVNGPTAKAFLYLNTVRSRAHATPINDAASKDAFRSIIQDERSRELCFEGLRKMDLKRWGIMIQDMKALAVYNRLVFTTNATILGRACLACDNVTEQHYYLPIPLNDLTLNKLITQNPGY